MESLTSNDYSLLNVVANQKDKFEKQTEKQNLESRLSSFGYQVAESMLGVHKSEEANKTANLIERLANRRHGVGSR